MRSDRRTVTVEVLRYSRETPYLRIPINLTTPFDKAYCQEPSTSISLLEVYAIWLFTTILSVTQLYTALAALSYVEHELLAKYAYSVLS